MAGRPGRSGGHNRLSLATHVIRGTFNPTRHGKLAAPGGPVWHPTAAELEPLGAAGRAFVARLQAVYDLSPIEGELAVEGGIAADRLAELRRRRGAAPATARQAVDRTELSWARALSAIILALRARL